MFIKKLKKGNKILRHEKIIDAMGLLRDVFTFEITEKNGHRTIIPFVMTTNYTKKEYEEMFKEQLNKLVWGMLKAKNQKLSEPKRNLEDNLWKAKSKEF